MMFRPSSLMFLPMVFAACGDSIRVTPDAAQGADARQPPDASQMIDASVDLAAWSKQFGEPSAKDIEGAKAVATDASGNIILVGDIWGAADFGGGVLKSAGGQDLFVAKLDRNGQHLWSKRFGDAGKFQVASAVAVDASGNVVVTGEFDGAVDFGGGELRSAGGGDIFVAKLDANGNHLWSKRFGDPADGQKGRSVAVDGEGNVLVAGELTGGGNFGGGPLTTTGGTDAFVVKLDRDGAHLWSQRFGGEGRTTAAAVRTDASNNVVFVGEFGLTVGFGGADDPVFTSLGGQDAYVTRLDASGGYLWSKQLGGNGRRQTGDAVAVDADGAVVVVTTFEGTVNLGGEDLSDEGYPTFGASNVGVVKLTSSGEHVWSKGFGDASRQFVRAVGLDAAGNPVIAGQFTGTINFGGADHPSKAKSLFYAKLDRAAGTEIWSKQAGNTGEVDTGGIVASPSGTLIFAGRFSGSVDFGTGAHTTASGDYDVVVAKLVDPS